MNTEEAYFDGIGSEFHIMSERGIYIQTEQISLIEAHSSWKRTWAEERRWQLMFKLRCIKSNWNKLWFALTVIPVVLIILGICVLFMMWNSSEINVVLWTWNGCYRSYIAVITLWEEMNCDPNDCTAMHKGKYMPYYYKYMKR